MASTASTSNSMPGTSDSMPSTSNSVASTSYSVASTSYSVASTSNSVASTSDSLASTSEFIAVIEGAVTILLSEHHMAYILQNLVVKRGCGIFAIVNDVWREASKTNVALPARMVVAGFPVHMLLIRGFQASRLNVDTLEVLEPPDTETERIGYRLYLYDGDSPALTCSLDFGLYCDNLSKLVIENCHRRDVLKLGTVVQTLKKLVELDLRRCFVRAKPEDLAVLLTAIDGSSIKTLRLESLVPVPPGNVNNILDFLDRPTHLENIKLVNCESVITPAAVIRMIKANRKSLNRLYLGQLGPDEFILPLSDAYFLRKLEIGNADRPATTANANNPDVEMEAMMTFPKFELKQITKLRWLFGQCPVCVYTNWKDMALCFPNVTVLSIRRSEDYHCKKFRVHDRGLTDYEGFLAPPSITFEEEDLIGDTDPHLLLWLRLWPKVKILKLNYNACTVYRGNIWGKMILPVMLNVPTADLLYVAKPHMSEPEVVELDETIPGMRVDMHKVKETSYLLVHRKWK